jgi:hypothetical protein
MRLINCTTQALEEVDEASIPPYAILSHRWESNKHQVLYQDFNNGEANTRQRDWAKIRATCKVAREGGLNYVWIDTCCFDKNSSAETSESINSMFRWYGNSKVCYAFLFDFDSQGPDALSSLGNSEWFYRGWTLQELVAPKRMQFFDCTWVYFGTRKELTPQIAAVTGIDEEILHSEDPGTLLPRIPIAKRMSWASNRQTSRVEDKAYSLLGLFSVNIPMLYGEGERAFIRLQEEILKQTTDLTLFAWKATPRTVLSSTSGSRIRGILAHSPSEFADAGHLVLQNDNILNPEFTMTNKGLRIEIAEQKLHGEATGFLSLNCLDRRSGDQETLGIYLKPVGGNTYVRYMPETLASMGQLLSNTIPRPVAYITKNIDAAKFQILQMSELSQEPPCTSIKFKFTRKFKYEYQTVGYPSQSWDEQSTSFDTQEFLSFVGFLQLKRLATKPHAIIACGFDSRGMAWVCVTKPGEAAFNAAMAQNVTKLAETCTRQKASSETCMITDMGKSTWFTVDASIREDRGGFLVHVELNPNIEAKCSVVLLKKLKSSKSCP